MSRSKAKTYIQPDENSCGPAALKNALQLLGIRMSYQSLESLCRPTKNGVSVEKLIRVANRIGLSVMRLEWATLTHLQNALKTKPGHPRAVMVDYLYKEDDLRPEEETGHYATIAGFSAGKNRIYLLDSYSGTKKSYQWPDFLDRWYDYDYKRVRAHHSIRRYALYRKWHNRLLLILAKNRRDLPKFTGASARIFSPPTKV